MIPNNPPDPELLNELLGSVGLQQLTDIQLEMFNAYLGLILKWNQRMNLTAIRNPMEILQRHFVECIACSYSLPGYIRTVLDFGTGAGLPGIPIAICRPDVSVTLAESQVKKAAFLEEVARTLHLNAKVFCGRAEEITELFDCVTLRAVDRMYEAVGHSSKLISAHGRLAVMSTRDSYSQLIHTSDKEIAWSIPISLQGSNQGVILLGRRK